VEPAYLSVSQWDCYNSKAMNSNISCFIYIIEEGKVEEVGMFEQYAESVTGAEDSAQW
jgi:hypothetical protein